MASDLTPQAAELLADWPAFGWIAGAAERRTRIARTPDRALVLVCDMPLTGLEYRAFAKGLEAFTADAVAAASIMGLGPSTGAGGGDSLSTFSPDEMIIIRP